MTQINDPLAIPQALQCLSKSKWGDESTETDEVDRSSMFCGPLTRDQCICEFGIDVKDRGEGLDGLSRSAGTDQYRCRPFRLPFHQPTSSIRRICDNAARTHGSKNLPWEQFVLILSSTCRPRLDGQTKCVELLCLPHIHVFRLNSILEISQSILRVSALVEGRLHSITE